MFTTPEVPDTPEVLILTEVMILISLKIHCHFGRFIFVQFRDLGLHDSVDPLAEVQDTGPVGRYDTGLIGFFLYDVAQDLPLCRDIEGTGGLI